MSKTALLFAGQGAQTVGMGRDLAEQLASARSWFERANQTLGYEENEEAQIKKRLRALGYLDSIVTR